MTYKGGLAYIGVLAMLVCGGCGYYALPSPTEKKVNPAQLVGKWQYKTDYDEATITLVLNADGTFIQNVPASSLGGARVQKGQWSLGGSYLLLEKALRYSDNKWQRSSYTCWIIDGYGINPSFRIFGGDGFQDDPDSGDVFDRVS